MGWTDLTFEQLAVRAVAWVLGFIGVSLLGGKTLSVLKRDRASGAAADALREDLKVVRDGRDRSDKRAEQQTDRADKMTTERNSAVQEDGALRERIRHLENDLSSARAQIFIIDEQLKAANVRVNEEIHQRYLAENQLRRAETELGGLRATMAQMRAGGDQ